MREASDYENFIARIERRFFEACAELNRISEDSAGIKTPCPSRPPRPARAAEIDQTTEQTRAERAAALSRDLDAALGEFDEMLLREQARVKAATPPPAARSAAGSGQGAMGDVAEAGRSEEAGDAGGLSAGGGATSRAAGEASAAGADTGTVFTAAGTGAGASPPGRSGSDGGRQPAASGGVPPDIPDGSDDDVVARQLREAAENESDPNLRARLWEEYRRYKRGSP